MKTMHCYFNFLFKLGQYYLSPAAQPAPRVHSSSLDADLGPLCPSECDFRI